LGCVSIQTVEQTSQEVIDMYRVIYEDKDGLTQSEDVTSGRKQQLVRDEQVIRWDPI